MSTQTPTLDVILGAEEGEPRFGVVNDDIVWLLKELRAREDQTFILATLKYGAKPTQYSIPTAAAVSEYMLRQALADGDVTRDETYVLFLIILFVLVLDDHIDVNLIRERKTHEEVKEYAEQLFDACTGGDVDHEDAVIRYAARLTALLRGYEAFDAYAHLYFRELKLMLRGMVREYAYSTHPKELESATLVDLELGLEGYMEDALHTSGVGLGLLACLVFLNDTRPLERVESLRLALDISGAIVRYLNDIRTFPRELEEGKFVSALGLAAQKFGIELTRIREALREQDIARIIRAMLVTEAYDLKDCLEYVTSRRAFRRIVQNAVVALTELYIVRQSDFDRFVLESAQAAP
ncbi:MAG: hypothetical protein R3A79_12820 [Nannocystaceae bacterium]